MKVHAVVIGTSGNQRYIFSSNKRRENVGASYLITRVEESWLDDALLEVTGSTDRDRRIDEHPVEVITANAGGITALVKDREDGVRLVTAVTVRALREAPGLDVCGVVGDPVEWDRAAGLAEAILRTRDALPVAAMARPGPQMRFAGLPIAARCMSSGLPPGSCGVNLRVRRSTPRTLRDRMLRVTPGRSPFEQGELHAGCS